VPLQIPPNCDLTLGMVCTDKSEPGLTVWQLTVDEKFANPVGTMQGGFLAAFADSAMSSATITRARGKKILTANTEMKISFLKPAPVGETLTCTARAIGGGRRITFVEAEVVDSSGVLIAKASSTFLISSPDA
jgi:uncharacterized protein (TIGR00369 family)